MSHQEKSSPELYQTFRDLALDLMKGGSPRVVYMKCNTMRNVWRELRRRGLPDPEWPDEAFRATKDIFPSFTLGKC